MIAAVGGLLAACPGTPPKGGGTGASGTTGTSGTPAIDAGVGQVDTPVDDGRRPLVSADGIACAQPRCIYHVGADAYHACLAAGAGTCFHFGPACTPGGSCMFDKASATYRACSKVDEGRCLAFGAPCEPEGKCYFNPDDLRHHACDNPSAGKCLAYGAPCEPRG